MEPGLYIFSFSLYEEKEANFYCHFTCKISCIRANLSGVYFSLSFFFLSPSLPPSSHKTPSWWCSWCLQSLCPQRWPWKTFLAVAEIAALSPVLSWHLMAMPSPLLSTRLGRYILIHSHPWWEGLISSCLWHSTVLGLLLYFEHHVIFFPSAAHRCWVGAVLIEKQLSLCFKN